MGAIEEIADTIRYRAEKCWNCPFGDGVTCGLYERHLNQDEEKPEWCHVDRIIVEFRR